MAMVLGGLAMVLGGLVSAVMEKLVDAGIKKLASILGVKSDMEDLQTSIQSISHLLDDAKSKKIEENSINLWFAKLREVMYDVEDLLDDWEVKADKIAAAAGETSWRAMLESLPSKVSQLFSDAFKNKIASRIKEINSTLDRLNSERSSLQLLKNLRDADKVSSLITGTSSFQLDSEIIGIDDDAEDLVYQIIRDRDDKHSVFAITGMPGSGKSTLARKVFYHDLIRNPFDNTVWVSVSRNPSCEELLKEIIRTIGKDCSESGVSKNELQTKLVEVVQEKSVFIVLDGIWDSGVWEECLRAPLLNGAKCSRILITTRNEEVAKEIKSVRYTHLMKKMNSSDSWSMLCNIVFDEEKMDDKKGFADVGKKIVEKCDGLPLAIKAVGGILRKKSHLEQWKSVLSSTTWSMTDLPEYVLPSLLLSYEDLPLHLKQCFTYCSLFPKDYQISQFNLQHLWIAEGLIEKEEGKDVEYSARDYYNELVMRNLVQADAPFHCKMHDLLRSLAIFVSQNQYIYLRPEDFHKSGLTRRHHLSFIGNVQGMEIKEEYCVRTLLLSDNPWITLILDDLLKSSQRLRVFDLQGTRIETLPDSLGTLIHLRFLNVSHTKLRKLPDSLGDLIHLRFLNVSHSQLTELSDSLGDLIHLRFLNVSHTKLRKLPDSIKNLKNLETLEANGVRYLRSLPMGICELFNLRCLRVDRLDNMPNGLDNLKNLKILKNFFVNDCSSSNMKELKDLSQLTDLSVYNLERVGSKEEAEEAAIEKKTSLECLELNCEPPPLISDEDIKKIEKVFAEIKLPENLMDLRIYGFFGEQLPDHMTSDHLRQLTSLELRNCKSLTRLPSLGDMPKLQRLKIHSAKSVVELGSEFLGSLKFPKLQKLKLKEMTTLETMFNVEERAFPCLVKLSISHCRGLKTTFDVKERAFPCLVKLSISHCQELERAFDVKKRAFPCLAKLSISHCPELKRAFDVKKGAFLCLVKLSISYCPGLNSLGKGWNDATCLETLEVKCVENLESIENMTSIYRLSISQSGLKYVKNLPSLKRMIIQECPALEDVNGVRKLDHLRIVDEEMKTLPRWLKSITPPKKLYVVGSEELVLGIKESVEDQNILKKCLHAEVVGGSLSYDSNSTGSSGASSSSVTIT